MICVRVRSDRSWNGGKRVLNGDREVVEKRVNLNKLCTVKMQSVSVQNRKKLCHQNWHSKGQGEKMKKSDNFREEK